MISRNTSIVEKNNKNFSLSPEVGVKIESKSRKLTLKGAKSKPVEQQQE